MAWLLQSLDVCLSVGLSLAWPPPLEFENQSPNSVPPGDLSPSPYMDRHRSPPMYNRWQVANCPPGIVFAWRIHSPRQPGQQIALSFSHRPLSSHRCGNCFFTQFLQRADQLSALATNSPCRFPDFRSRVSSSPSRVLAAHSCIHSRLRAMRCVNRGEPQCLPLPPMSPVPFPSFSQVK